jgi:hypothetical protein
MTARGAACTARLTVTAKIDSSHISTGPPISVAMRPAGISRGKMAVRVGGDHDQRAGEHRANGLR